MLCERFLATLAIIKYSLDKHYTHLSSVIPIPAFAHLFFSIGLAIFLWKVTEGRFSMKPAIAFIVNNAYGPDLLGAFLEYNDPVYLFFHGMGWYIFAIPFAFLWFYILNGKVYKFRTGKSAFTRIHLLEKEKQLPYWRIYLFIAAGGMTHQLIDIIGHPAFIHSGDLGTHVAWGAVWFGNNSFMSLDWVLSTGVYPGGFYTPAVILTVGYLLGILLAIFWGMHSKSFWNMVKGMLIVISTLFVIYVITYFMAWPNADAWLNAEYMGDYTYYGDPNNIPLLVYITGGEADFGVMVFLGLFFFSPLIMLYYGFRDLPKGEERESAAGFGDKKPAAKEAPAPYLK